MDVVTSGPLRVAGFRWLLSNGAPALTVICKATFSLRPGESPLAPQQDEPNEEDTYWDDDPQRSLSASTDLVPFKARADVVLVGNAFSPAPVRSLAARLVVGAIDKSIEVHADRAFGADGVLREGVAFTKMRLRYERTAGGPETANPVGMRFDAYDARGNTMIPNLQPRGAQIARRGDGFPPVGFSPIAPTWPERAAKIHRSSPGWSPFDWASRPLPDGFDSSYFNFAPADQQVDSIRPEDRIHLEYLHAEHPRLTTTLADVSPRAVIERPGHGSQALVLVCDTLSIDTDRAVCHLVWRGTVRLAHPAETGRVVVSAGEAPAAREPSRASFEEMADKTVSPLALSGAFMPFMRKPAAEERPAPRPPLPAPLPAPLPPAAAPPRVPSIDIAPSSVQYAVPQRAPIEASPWATHGAEPASARASIGERLAHEAPAATPLPSPEPAPARQISRRSSSEAVDLLWFDIESVARIRKRPPWRVLLTDLESSKEVDPEEGVLGNTPEEIEDRRDVLHVLVHGSPIDDYGISEALEHAVRADGKVINPIVLTSGQLAFTFDELEMLKATLSAAMPFAQGDEALTAATSSAKEFLATPGLIATGAVIEALTGRVREAFGRVKRPVAADYLQVQSERALLEKRHYQKREVFSKTQLRGLLLPVGASSPIPAYIPEEVAKKLPLYQRFPVRVIAEVHRTADQNEVHPAALRALALGRTVPAR